MRCTPAAGNKVLARTCSSVARSFESSSWQLDSPDSRAKEEGLTWQDAHFCGSGAWGRRAPKEAHWSCLPGGLQAPAGIDITSCQRRRLVVSPANHEPLRRASSRCGRRKDQRGRAMIVPRGSNIRTHSALPRGRRTSACGTPHACRGRFLNRHPAKALL